MSVGIFTGAGASAPLGLPVMKDMLDADFRREKIEQGLERAVYDVAANWAAAQSDDESLDFELLYTAVDTFADMKLSGLEALPFVPHRGGPGFYFLDGKGGKSKLNVNKVRRQSQSLRTKLETRVHNLVGEVDAETAAELYMPLLKAVHLARPAGTVGEAGTGNIFMFTTNYDRAIEAPFWEGLSDSSVANFKLIDGMSRQGPGPRAFDNQEYDKQPGSGEVFLKLFKLHGSLHWRRQGDRVLESAGDEYVGRNALIYPLRAPKDQLPGPFPALFRRFRNALEENIQTLLVIGSSFRDQHIQNIVVEAMKGSGALERLILLDPQAEQIARTLNNRGIRKGEIETLPQRFGKDESLEAVEAALLERTGAMHTRWEGNQMPAVHSLSPRSVKRHARSGSKGVYTLWNSRSGPPRYVGRSDSDVQRRLLQQARKTDYSFFTVEHMNSTKEAWHREANLYHYHKSTLDNKRHPQAPKGMGCPRCSAV